MYKQGRLCCVTGPLSETPQSGNMSDRLNKKEKERKETSGKDDDSGCASDKGTDWKSGSTWEHLNPLKYTHTHTYSLQLFTQMMSDNTGAVTSQHTFTLQSDHGLKRNNLNVARIKIGRNKQVSISDSPHLSLIPLSLSLCLSVISTSSLFFLLFHFIVFLSSGHKTLYLQPILLVLIHFSVLLHLSVLLISSALKGFTYSAHPVACNDLAWVCVHVRKKEGGMGRG